ncbi:MAG TPA: hypothetical protein PLP27_04255 [Crocinitomicaceae bacterium]|nr:hypothetical protein [Crocinitomicaceae bacterium]
MIRDTLKDQIERIGKNLKKVITKFLEIELLEDRALQITKTNQELKNELDIDLDLLSSYSVSDILDYIKERKLTAKHLELLVDYTSLIASIYLEQNNREIAKIWFQKSIDLLTVADIVSESLSMERMQRKEKLQKFIA